MKMVKLVRHAGPFVWKPLWTVYFYPLELGRMHPYPFENFQLARQWIWWFLKDGWKAIEWPAEGELSRTETL